MRVLVRVLCYVCVCSFVCWFVYRWCVCDGGGECSSCVGLCVRVLVRVLGCGAAVCL